MASVRKREWTHKGQKKEAWVVAYTDRHGDRRLKTFDKKKDADKYRTQVEVEVGQGTHVAPAASITVRALMGVWLEHMEARQRQGEIGAYHLEQMQRFSRLHIVPRLGDRLLPDLTFTVCDAWLADIAATKALRQGTRGKKLGAQAISANHRLAIALAFRKAMDYAVKRGWAAINNVAVAMRDRGNRRSDRTADRIRTFTTEEMERLLLAVDQRRFRQNERTFRMMKIAVHLAAFCGLRRGEVLGLTVDHIDTVNRVVRVRHSLTEYNELKGPKTASGVRDVPLPPHLVPVVEEWKRDHFVPNDRNLLFVGRERASFAGSTFTAVHWWAALRHAGLDRCAKKGEFHFHALRHYAASSWVEAGMPITDVAKLMGHSKFDETLQIYAHPLRRAEQHAATVMGIAERLLPKAEAASLSS